MDCSLCVKSERATEQLRLPICQRHEDNHLVLTTKHHEGWSNILCSLPECTCLQCRRSQSPPTTPPPPSSPRPLLSCAVNQAPTLRECNQCWNIYDIVHLDQLSEFQKPCSRHHNYAGSGPNCSIRIFFVALNLRTDSS